MEFRYQKLEERTKNQESFPHEIHLTLLAYGTPLIAVERFRNPSFILTASDGEL